MAKSPTRSNRASSPRLLGSSQLLLLPALMISSMLLSGCHNSSSEAAGTPGGSLQLQEIVFLSRQEIAPGAEGLRSVLARDFTGDGVPDLITSSIVDNRIVFLAASAAGSFSTQQTSVFSFNEAPSLLAAGDFDGDSDLDFACVFQGTATVRVWRNDGAGRFSEDAQPLQGGDGASVLEVIDANNDGLDDLVVSRSGALAVRYFPGQSSGFGAAVDLSASGQGFLAGMAQGDLNGDGFPELAVCNGTSNEVLIYDGSAQGPATTPSRVISVPGQGVYTASLADMDRDGFRDLVVACYGCGALVMMPGDGQGGFGAAKVTPGDGNPLHVSVGDVNGDGNLDAVLSYLDRASIGFLAGDGQGGFAAERQFGTTGLPTMSEIVDLDQDGNMDVLTSGLDAMHLSWIRGLGSEGLQGAEHFATGHQAPNFTVAHDFDGDGYADAMASDRLAALVSVLPGGADGRFGATAFESPVGNLPGALTKGDFDQDGRIDAVVSVSGGLRFLLNRSSPGQLDFELWPAASQPPFGVGVGPFELAPMDANGDGALDLAVADFGGNKVQLLLGLAGQFGFAPQPFEIDVQGGPLSLVSGDFDRDGKPDAAVSRYYDGFVTILRGDGAGQFSVAADLPTGAQPNYIRKADFDGNGSEDLVVSNLQGTELTLFLSQAIDSWSSQSLRVGDGPTALLARDLDRDGKADILVASSVSADFHVLIGDGTGGFPIVKRFPGTWGALSADLADVDGDGLEDFVIASLYANRLGLYRNRSK
jgi:hypothetical protein